MRKLGRCDPAPTSGPAVRPQAHERCVRSDGKAKRGEAGSDLFVVSKTFVHLQEKRHEADYDLTVSFSVFDVTADLRAAISAFESWERIKRHQSARDYLFSPLFRDRTQ
jgi:hypothetical protein